MLEGNITFRTSLPDIEFDAIEFMTSCPGVLKATIASGSENGATLQISIAGATSINEAIALAKEIAQQVTNILSFEFGLGIEVFRYAEHSFLEVSNQNQVFHVGDSINIRDAAICSVKLGHSNREKLKSILEQADENCYLYYEMFRVALCLTDPLATFMALYSIVLSLSDDLQEKVDHFVILIQPNVQINLPYRKRKSAIPETIYTRLRNEVGHIRPGATIQETRNEMTKNLAGLIEVTKQIIKSQCIVRHL